MHFFGPKICTSCSIFIYIFTKIYLSLTFLSFIPWLWRFYISVLFAIYIWLRRHIFKSYTDLGDFASEFLFDIYLTSKTILYVILWLWRLCISVGLATCIDFCDIFLFHTLTLLTLYLCISCDICLILETYLYIIHWLWRVYISVLLGIYIWLRRHIFIFYSNFDDFVSNYYS